MRSSHLVMVALAASLLAAGPAGAEDPVTYHCDDGSDVTATFIEIEPPAAIVIDRGTLHALSLRRSGSGARYATGGEAPDVTFWTKGEEAIFGVAGKLERTCKAEPR
ncbi:MAG: MliC family protein [Kiloniellaceae bacterium]